MRKFSWIMCIAILTACLILTLPAEVHAAEIVDSGTCGEHLNWVLDASGVLTISGFGEMYSFEFNNQPWADVSEVSTVIVEQGVTSIGNYAFYGFPNLVEVTIAESVTSIGASAFSDCYRLTSIYLHDSVCSIGVAVFANCSSLIDVKLSESLEQISASAFSYCVSLESIAIPDSVVQINADAFAYCNSLKQVLYANGADGWNNIAIDYGNTQLENAYKITNCTHPFWQDGVVKKTATCKEEGIISYTCTECPFIIEEPIAKTNEHNYGAWIEQGSGHQQTCSICQEVKTGNHSWNSGITIRQATCKEGGQVKYTCTICNAIKTQDTAKTNDHKYGGWTKVNDTTHKHTCTVCQKEEAASHSWNSGAITKQATCKEEGVKSYTCTGCSATKIESIAKLTTHTYDHACDADCNVCDATRTITHKYKTSWSKSKTEHWHECTVCKEKKDAAVHIPGAEATEKKAQTCTVCGYIIKPVLGHKHDYATKWTMDDKGHWYACSGCEEKGSYADHNFENACDKDCSICGYARETNHAYEEKWTSDETDHWHVCTGCGLKADEAAHEPGAEATETNAQTCTICGYEIAPSLGDETAEPTDEPKSTTPVEQEKPADSSFPWGIIIVAVVVIGGAVAFVTIRKKNT